MYVEDRRALFDGSTSVVCCPDAARAVVILYVYKIFVKSFNGVS